MRKHSGKLKNVQRVVRGAGSVLEIMPARRSASTGSFISDRVRLQKDAVRVARDFTGAFRKLTDAR